MKYKVFMGLLVSILTLGTMALADYVEPGSTPPSSNTPEVLKTESESARLYEKLGIGDGTNSVAASLLSNGPYILQGAFSDKFVSLGAGNVGTSTLPKNFVVKVPNIGNLGNTNFDQFKNQANFFKFPGNTKTVAKPLEAIVAGRYISKVAITSDEDPATSQKPNGSNPNSFSLDLKATTGSNGFSPTTNIGLGNTCNLYYYDIGSSVGDGGGCPAGMFMSMYKAQTYSGTATSSSNTNNQVVATCTSFNPSASPTNTGHCDTGRFFTDLDGIYKEPENQTTGSCVFTLGSARNVGGSVDTASFLGAKSRKIRWYVLGGNPSPAYYSAGDDKTYISYGCSSNWKAVVYDDYGQYIETSKMK